MRHLFQAGNSKYSDGIINETRKSGRLPVVIVSKMSQKAKLLRRLRTYGYLNGKVDWLKDKANVQDF